MSFTPILPPFPFPERWKEIYLLQCASGEKKWLVPSVETDERATVLHINSENTGDQTHQDVIDDAYEQLPSTIEILPTELDWTDEVGEEYETFELNPDWAARFSKTIKKMKQKIHKAKRRAEWKKK